VIEIHNLSTIYRRIGRNPDQEGWTTGLASGAGAIEIKSFTVGAEAQGRDQWWFNYTINSYYLLEIASTPTPEQQLQYATTT
jgi:hypothetical protein